MAEFDRLLARHKDAVYRQMVRVCGNRDDAEDALVEAMLSAYRAMGQLEDPAAFGGWLATIARRVCLRMRRREELAPILNLDASPTLTQTLADPGPLPLEALEMGELKACVQQAVGRLPELYRDVYVMREVEERTANETAARLGLTIPALKSRLHRARAMVREALDQGVCGPV
jgi:RNA polymerase sigma-70 factor (ECF subfamily)